MDEQDIQKLEEASNECFGNNAMPVCPDCLTPCDPLASYCFYCDNKISNPQISYRYQQKPYNMGILGSLIGKLWQKSWNSDEAILLRIGYVFVILFFFPYLALALPVVIYEKIKKAVQRHRLRNRLCTA